MENRVFFEPEYYFESMALLINAQNGSTVRSVLTEMFHSDATDARDSKLEQVYEACAGFEEAVCAEHACTGDEAAFLLGAHDTCEPCAHAFWHYQFRDEKLPIHKRASIANLTAQANEDDSPTITEESFFAWLDGSDFSPEVRYDLLKLYHRFDVYDRFMREQVDAVTPLIRRQLPQVQKIIDEKMGYVQGQLSGRGIAFLSDVLNISLDDSHAYDIYPSLARPNAMHMFGQDDLPRVAVILGVGVLDTVRFVEGNQYNSKRLLRFAKALADPTKWNILMTLRTESLYSAQLAERMNLSGATISHHMSALTSIGVVLVRKQGNRIYYEINRPTMEHFLSELSRQLLPGAAQKA